MRRGAETRIGVKLYFFLDVVRTWWKRGGEERKGCLPCLCIRNRIRFGASDSLPSWFRLWGIGKIGEISVCAW